MNRSAGNSRRVAMPLPPPSKKVQKIIEGVDQYNDNLWRQQSNADVQRSSYQNYQEQHRSQASEGRLEEPYRAQHQDHYSREQSRTQYTQDWTQDFEQRSR